MIKCDLCQADKGVYLFSKICCKVRYLMTQDLQSRRFWIERWEKKHGSAATAKLKAEFAIAWAEREANNHLI